MAHSKKNNTNEFSKVDRRNKQLQDHAVDIDWTNLIQLIVHFYVESGIGRLQVPVETMIRIYFLQLRYNLTGNEAALAMARIDVFADFALINRKTDVLPDAESIDMFASLIELKGLEKQFAKAFKIRNID